MSKQVDELLWVSVIGQGAVGEWKAPCKLVNIQTGESVDARPN